MTTFIPGEVVDAVIRPEDFDLVVDNPDSAILQGVVTKTAFTGVTFNLWINVNGKTIMVQDYCNVEVGDRIGLKVDFYEIHLMKVEDSEQPKEIQELRAQARELAAKLDEEENEKI
jgi:spermidine/putrescine transport system ATP-binding protein